MLILYKKIGIILYNRNRFIHVPMCNISDELFLPNSLCLTLYMRKIRWINIGWIFDQTLEQILVILEYFKKMCTVFSPFSPFSLYNKKKTICRKIVLCNIIDICCVIYESTYWRSVFWQNMLESTFTLNGYHSVDISRFGQSAMFVLPITEVSNEFFCT